MCQRAQIFVDEEEVEDELSVVAAGSVSPPGPAPNDPRPDAVAVSR